MDLKKQVAKNRVIVIQKEKRQLDFFKVPGPKKISDRPDKLEKWVQIDWTNASHMFN